MFPKQLMGLNWPALKDHVERSDRWRSWVAVEAVLAELNGLDEVVAIVENRSDPGRADAVLAALVRLGAVAGGNDLDAAQAVALLLTNGAGRLARQLGNLSGNIEEIVAGQVWLQIREFPCGRRRRAIAQNILMDARRAVLRDLGVDTDSRWLGRSPLTARAPLSITIPARDRATSPPFGRSWSGLRARVWSPIGTRRSSESWPALK